MFRRSQILSKEHLSCQQKKGRQGCSVAPFQYRWSPSDCEIHDFTTSQFIDSIHDRLVSEINHTRRDENTPPRLPSNIDVGVKFVFAGDSTMFYLCKVFATVLSNYNLKMHTPKFTQSSEHHELENTFNFTSRHGNALSVHCIRSQDARISTSPSGQAVLLKRELDRMRGDLRRTPSVFVIGDSNAHSLCHAGENEVLSGSRKLISVVKELQRFAGVRVVWVGPGFVGKTFNLLAQELHKKQTALWKGDADLTFSSTTVPGKNMFGNGTANSFEAGRSRSVAVVVDQWQMTAPVFHELSRDGIHYHAILGPSKVGQESNGKVKSYVCDRFIDGSARSGNSSLGCYSGPVPIYVLKIMVNALLES